MPFPLPSAGQALHVGGNTFDDIRPSGATSATWNYVNLQAWGSGVWVPGYGSMGAYVIPGACGGHDDGCSFYSPLWDVSTGLWRRLDPTNTIDRYLGTNHNVSETSGSPYYEVSGTTPPNSVPAACHPYRNAVAHGGDVLWVGRAAVCRDSVSSPTVHKVALGSSTCTYSRFTSNASASGRIGPDACVVPLADGLCYHVDASNNARTSVETFSAATGEWGLSGTYALPANECSGNGYVFGHLGRYLVKRGSGTTHFLFDRLSASAGWSALTVTGAPPASATNMPAECGGAYFWVPNGGGSVLTKGVVDAGAGSITFAAVNLSFGSVPAHPTTNNHYTASWGMSIAGVSYIGHCVGGAHGMHIIRPE